ncbi:MAG: bacteriocin [Streptococcus suis]
MKNFNTIEQNYTVLTDVELQEVDGGGLLIIIGGLAGGGLLLWGGYNGYQSAAMGG